jgi:hypothetical protein
VRVYLTDANLNLVEKGEKGQVCVSGVLLPLSYTGIGREADESITENEIGYSSECALAVNPFYRTGDDRACKHL